MIIPVKYDWNGTLDKRDKTTYIILHHAAASVASAEDIHRWHQEKGWIGFGYHFLIAKDGDIYKGRPIDTVGAHCEDWNYKSVGICFEGDFDQEEMTAEQVKSGIELIRLIRSQYKGVSVMRHRDCGGKSTCPGSNFRNYVIFEGSKDAMDKVNTTEEALKVLVDRGVISSPDYWRKAADVVKNMEALLMNMANVLLKK
jgi:hypothetical protein